MRRNRKTTQEIANEINAIRQERRQQNRERQALLNSYIPQGPVSNLESYSAQEQESGKSWYDNAIDYAKSIPGQILEDVPNVLRMTFERRALGFIKEKQEQLRELQNDEDALNLIKEYRNCIDSYHDLLFQGKAGSTEAKNLLGRIDELDNFFKSPEGRSNPIIAEIMYDKDNTTLTQDLKTLGHYLVKGTEPIEDLPENWQDRSMFQEWGRELGNLWTGFENALQIAGNTISLGVDATGKAVGLVDRGKITRDAIMSSAEGGPDFISEDLYIGADVANRNDLIDKMNDMSIDQQNRKTQYNDELDTYIEDFNEGNIRVPFSTVPKSVMKWFAPSKKYYGNPGWRIKDAFDPEDVSQEWRDNQELLSGSIWHPVYMIPEIGSTLGMIEGMLGSMTINVAAEAAIRKLPSLALGGKKYKMALDAAMAAGDTEKLRKILGAKEVFEASNKWKALKYGIRSAEIGSELAITTQQRVLETNQEAMDAVSSRLQKDAIAKGANMTNVMKAILNYEVEHGIDPSRMSATDLIGEAIARDIDTGDPIFEKAKKDSLKGIMKLINANNVLAVSDYLQTFPYLSYGEKILSKAGKRIKDAIFKSGTKLALSESERHILGAYDGYVDHLSKWFMKDGKFFAGLAANRVGKYTWDKVKKFAPTMAMEGYEEGVQTTLLQRFENGEFDDYNKQYSQFSMAELMLLPELDIHVTKALLGMNGAGDDEIRKAVVIGAFIGSIFPGVGSAFSNLRSDPSLQNIKNLTKQLKNDRVMTQMISNNFHDIGDEKRIRTFIEAFHRTGVSPERIMRSLYDIKGNISQDNQYITPDMVDEDIKLLAATAYMYNNKKIQELAEKNGIEKYSQQHKDIITNGAKLIADRGMSQEAVEETLKNIVSLLDESRGLVDELFADATTEERKQQIYALNPELAKLVNVVQNMYSSYQESIEKALLVAEIKNNLIKAQYTDKYMSMSPEELVNVGEDGLNSILKLTIDQLKHDGEIKNDNLPQSTLISIATRSLRDLNFKRGVVQNYIAQLPYETIQEQETPQELIKSYLTALHVKNQLKHARSLYTMLHDIDIRKREARAITGVDIDTDTLGGMIKSLQNSIENLQKIEKQIVTDENQTLDDVFSDDFADIKFDKQDELDKYDKSNLLNLSLHFALSKLASAYVDPASKTPGELNTAIFGYSNADSFLLQSVKDYEEKEAAIALLPISRKRQGQGFDADEADLRAMREQSAWDVIKNDLTRVQNERARIVRRAFEDNSLEEPSVQEQPVDQSQEENAAAEEENKKLEQALLSGEDTAEKLEELTMNLSPEEVERRRLKKRIQERNKQKQQQQLQQELEELKNTAEQDPEEVIPSLNELRTVIPNRQDNNDQNQQNEETLNPTIINIVKPKVDGAVVGDAIGNTVLIDNGVIYYQYPVTFNNPGSSIITIQHIWADKDGNRSNEFDNFPAKLPVGYEFVDPSKAENITFNTIVMDIDANPGEICGYVKVGDEPVLIRKIETKSPVIPSVKQQIDQLESDPSFGGKPVLSKPQDGPVVIKTEMIIYLSDGQILGKIEENGQTYYYVVKRTEEERGDLKYSTFSIQKFDGSGAQVVDNEGCNIVLDDSKKWNVNTNTPGNADAVSILYSEETNTPVHMEFTSNGTVIEEASIIGTESIGDENTKDKNQIIEENQQPVDDPQIDDYQEEDHEQEAGNQDIEDQYQQQAAIDQIENEKLEQEAQQELAINIVANEAIVNNSADFSSTPNGGIAVGGLELDPITQQLLEDQALQLYDIDLLADYDQNELPSPNHKKSESQTRDEAYDYVSDVFFYRPDETDVMKLRINGKDVHLRKTLKSGSEFAKKLLQKGWLESCYSNGGVYYIVTQAADAAANRENRNVNDDADTFTVTLIVEDPNEDACYACSLRQLGKYISIGTEKDPVTGEDRVDQNGQKIPKEFPINHEKEVRDKLSRIHTVHKPGTSRQKTFENERKGVAYNYYERLYGPRPLKPSDNASQQEIDKYLDDLEKWQNKVDDWADPEKRLPRWTKETDDHYAERVRLREEALPRINQDARFNLRQIGKTPMTDAEIDKAIENLRKTRMQIIDAYLTKDANGRYVFPEEIRTDVIPEVVTRSNGRFNNQKTAGGAPILQNVSREGNPFGVKPGVSQINTQIQNGEIKIGIGSGALRTSNIDAIQDFREGNESTTYDGKGLAGKVYIVAKTVNNTDVPVMLVELKFNEQHDDTDIPTMIGNVGDQLKLCIDPFTGEVINNTSGIKPSAAEAILYMLFGRLSNGQFATNQDGLQQLFASFIVHNGIDTLLNDPNVEAVLPYYAAKQLAVVNGVLYIGMPIGNGLYRIRTYTESELFSGISEDEKRLASEKRQEVIRAIASQMHWNTDKETMNEKFGGKMTNLIAAELEKYFQVHPEQSTYTIAGVKEFTFNKTDLFEVNEKGVPTRIKRNMTMAAWLLHAGKLSSDVGDTVFRDPFVFGSGVKSSQLKSDAQAADAVLDTGDIDLTRTSAHLSDESKMTTLRNRMGSVASKHAIHSEKEYIDAMIESERNINSELTQQHGPTVRVLALDLPILAGNKLVKEEDLIQAIKDKVNDLVQNLDPKQVGVEKLTFDDSTFEALTKLDYNALKARKIGHILTARIFENGHIRLQTLHYAGRYVKPEKGSTYVVNGVYQHNKTKGTFDEQSARKWLLDKLGLKPHQVFVSNAMLRGTDGEKAFGLTNIAFDTILGEITGNMMFRRDSGAGTHYHEAFHYVNLLLHNPKLRVALYEDYVKTHKKLRGAEYKDIEEEMAEDFRNWAERENSTKLSDKIRKFFSRILDMLIASRRKSQYRSVFKAIQNGEYSNNYHLDPEAAKEFAKEYPNGAAMLYIPMLSTQCCANLSKTFNNAVEFYQVADAIVDFIINESALNTPKDIIDLAGKNFRDVITKLRLRAKEVDENSREMLLAFVDNPEALLRHLMNRFDSLGIIVKEKRLDSKKDSEDDADIKEDNPDNIWDKFQFTISKKDNVSLAAKLFLRQIPSARFILDDNGEKVLIYDENEIIPGCTKYTLYDVAWNQILSEANHCSGYGVLDENNNYPPNSFRGIVKRAAKASAFFAALDEKLDEIEYNPTLKTQIYSAVDSQKPNIYFHEIQAAKAVGLLISEEDIDDLSEEDLKRLQELALRESAADVMKQWVFRNDNALLAIRNIPRRWSDSALLSGILDEKKSPASISEVFVNTAQQYKQDIAIVFNTAKKNKKNDWIDTYNQLTDLVCQLCNYFGIIMDSDVIDYFVNIKSDSESYEIKSQVLRDSFAKNTTGTFGYIVQLLGENVGQQQIVYKLGRDDSNKRRPFAEPKPLDKLFSGTKASSDISKLALAYHAIHPSSSEFGVMGPNKEMLYPNSQNNMQSAKLRNINTTAGQHALDMMRSPYAAHSIIFNTAKNFDEVVSKDDQFSLNLEVGLKDATSLEGLDFFGITALEDYIQKMLSLDQDPDYTPAKSKDYKSNEATYLVSPTMADKKTHYTISSKNAQFRTSHSPVIGQLHMNMLYYPQVVKYAKDVYGLDSTTLKGQEAVNLLTEFVQADPSFGFRQFGAETITRFAGYLLDELNALEQYYNPENIKDLIANPNKMKSNYHGNIVGGKMDFSGNGGKFRYFYDLEASSKNEGMNFNQKLEWLYKLEKDILQGKIKTQNLSDSLKEIISLQDVDPSSKRVSDFDGFELVRNELKRIRDMFFDKLGNYTQALQDALNRKLAAMVDAELYMTSTDQRIKLCEYIPSMNAYVPTAVPAQLLSRQNQRFLKAGLGGSASYIPYRTLINDAIMFYSLMANHVVNTFTSIIEFEKVFSSDPAFYQWKGIKGDNATEAHTLTYELPSGETIEREYYVSNVGDKFSDKIKRLGSILSPGDEMRLDLSEYERTDSELNPEGLLNSSHYSVLVVDDISAKSKFLDSIIRPKFKNCLIGDYIRKNPTEEIKKYIEFRKKSDSKYNIERLINEILDNKRFKYSEEIEDISDKSADNSLNDEFEEYFFNFEDVQDSAIQQLREEYRTKGLTISEYIFNLLPKNIRNEINKQLQQQSKPYDDINVSDAQIFVRPLVYRKIRISLGQWSTEVDETGYSDEVAYWLLENDPDWLKDPEKAAMVSKLELFPLKMSYVANENEDITGKGYYLNVGTLDKAAYFPLFKYSASNQTGRDLYDRMNRENNEIDMVAFVSAVKVGAPKTLTPLYGSKQTESLGKFDDALNKDSDTRIKYDVYSETGDDIEYKIGDDLLPILIQDFSYLRYQLNTRSHEASERKVGSQMAKLCYSNIIDNALYGRNKSGRNPRLGSAIKVDIMACINALTKLESAALESKYYKNGRVNRDKVHGWLERVTGTNGLGAVAEQIMSTGVAECLNSRVFFEQTIAAAVGKSVVDINMNGGTAVQQSMIGFNDYDGRHTISDEDLINRNNLLQSEASAVFEFSIKDDKLLEKHNIKTVEDFLNSNLSILDRKDIKDTIEYLNLHVGDKIVKGFHKINGGKEIKWHAKENTMLVILSMNFFNSIIPSDLKTYDEKRAWLIKNNIIGENAKPFGVGYRIPTQGMSSIFAFQVADVLPEQSGDLIIVPREFTAQTGSDFDVDKLYLATFAYEKVVEGEGENAVTTYKKSSIKQDLSKITNLKDLTKAYENESIKAVQNQLLDSFIDVISDDRNYSDSRASIDTVTNLIKENLLSWLRPGQQHYVSGMYELLPSFQSLRKEEFKVGKDGIGPFALNTVNISLTQNSHLSLNYDAIFGGNPYNFGHLDQVDGLDGIRISAWLSAMINANVDVAKDPYVFILNAVKATYPYVNFLLRAGKGITTFTFLTQPILIDYATLVSNAGGMYGQNLDGTNTLNKSFTQKKNEIKKNLKQKYTNIAESLLLSVPKEYWEKHKAEFTHMMSIITASKYYTTYTSDLRNDFKKTNNGKAPEYKFNKGKIFNYEVAKKSILDFNNPKYTIDKLRAAVYQLCVMNAFEEIEPCANAISELVNISQIDTKKFGNSIVKLQNFENRLMDFIYNPKYPWIINGKDNVNKKETEQKVQDPTATLALETYFKQSFLWDKFQAAKKYTIELASGELLSGTREYYKIFEQVAMEVNGTLEYSTPAFKLNPETNKLERDYEENKQGVKVRKFNPAHKTFNPFLKEETIQTLSTALNNIMRFNILMNVGPKVLGNEEQLKLLADLFHDFYDDGPIDFTHGGDYVKTVIDIHRLIFGDGVQPSLPIRIKEFVSEILNDPFGDKAQGIVENGKIVNKFLLYLNPIPATEEIPIDRLNLNESAIRTSKELKPILSSYWDLLLNHPNSEVRKLARDIVLYSYYTTYDTLSINCITDLIPPTFRSQYDKAITRAVRLSDGVKLKDTLNTFFGMTDINSIIDEAGLPVLYYDIVARNYWYDDDIVRRYTEHGQGIMKPKSNYVEYRTGHAFYGKNKQRFAGMIITSNLGENAPLFMKIVKNGDTVLYRRVGQISKFNEKGKNEMKDTYVYLAVQKAGMHVGKTHMFEFFKSQYIPSMFEWNMLPGQWNHKLLLEQLLNDIKSWSKQSGMRYVYTPQNEINIPLTDSSKYDSQVYKEIIKEKQKSLYSGTVSVDIRKNPEEDARRQSDLIIKFVNKVPENKSELEYSGKTIYIDVTDHNNLALIFEQLDELKFDSRRGVGIHVEADESLFEVSDEETEPHMNELVQYYIDLATQNNAHVSDAELRQLEYNIRNEYEDYIKEYSKTKKLADAINIVFQSMITNGYNLQRIYAAGMNNVSRAAVNAYEHNIDSFSTRFSYIFVSKDDYKLDSYDEFIQMLLEEIQVLDLYVKNDGIAEEINQMEQEDAENLANYDPFEESEDDEDMNLDILPEENEESSAEDDVFEEDEDDMLDENVFAKETSKAEENKDNAEHTGC